jgi:hypothetical protein
VTTRDTATIEIPRLADEDEPPRAYAARVAYLTMGPERSLAKVRQQIGKRSVRYLEEWSSRYRWVEQARNYDSVSAQVAVARHRAEYDKALEEHRRKVLEKTASLSKILDGLEAQVARALTGQVIEGKDGKTYYIPKMPIEVSAVAALMRGRLTVADMEAHALDIPGLRAALLEGDTE